MSHVTKLVLAVGLALGAAALNALWLTAEKRPATFVAAGADVKAGETIVEAMLADVPVPGDADKLRKSLIPSGSRALILGRKAQRAYLQGDVFFQRDIQAPIELGQFETLGPFRLIGVGERFTQPGGGKSEENVTSSGNNITIAVSSKYDEQTRRLLEIVDPNRKDSSENRPVKIVAVQVVPKEQQPEVPAADAKNVVYQTVSLEGIASVPRVLLQGDVIQFVIPKTSSF